MIIGPEFEENARILFFLRRKIGHMMISRSCRLVTSGRSVAFFSTRNVSTSKEQNFREIEMKVPWGKIAGKLWNPNQSQPILAVHGWQDNAGSFDNLIPLLPKNISVLAIDMPGHGYSSWIPDGMMYTKVMYVQTIDRVRRHFDWETVGFLGHSFGAMFSFTYSAFFPRNTKFVIALDYYKYLVENVGVRTTKAAQDLDTFMKMEKRQRPSSTCTEKEMIKRIIRASDDTLDEKSYRALMVRGVTKKSDDCVYLNRDPRVKLIDLTAAFTDGHLREKAELVRCPYMVLKAQQSGYGEQKSSYTGVLSTLEKSCSDFQFFTIPGKHHFHLTNPTEVAKHVTPFLEKYN